MTTVRKDYIGEITKKIDGKMKTRAEKVAEQLAPAYHSGDTQKVPRAVWLDMIRRNWQDQNWRAEHAFKVGPVQLVQDALEAHGLNPALLHQNADVVKLGLSKWNVDASDKYAEHVASLAAEHGLPNMPPENFPVNNPEPGQQ